MNLRSTSVFTFFLVAAATILFQACKHEPVTEVDQDLLDMAKATIGFTWYKNSDAWLPASSGTGHNYSNLRTRYNTEAATQLDSTGKVIANALFPEGSFIVKELSDNNSVQRYAMLYKMSDSPHADDNGWVWGYVDSDGKIAESAAEQGSICIGCHTQSENIDYMLMNKFFP